MQSHEHFERGRQKQLKSNNNDGQDDGLSKESESKFQSFPSGFGISSYQIESSAVISQSVGTAADVTAISSPSASHKEHAILAPRGSHPLNGQVHD
jgi:hypothetical protein